MRAIDITISDTTGKLSMLCGIPRLAESRPARPQRRRRKPTRQHCSDRCLGRTSELAPASDHEAAWIGTPRSGKSTDVPIFKPLPALPGDVRCVPSVRATWQIGRSGAEERAPSSLVLAMAEDGLAQ